MPKQSCYSIAPSLRQGQGTLSRSRPLVIGHGGAAFSIPEHTLESYQLAFELGANYVEPDFYPTKEGRLVARHDVDLNTTTNVAQIFPNRSRTLRLSGAPMTAYFTFDFTLDEIRQLRARQRMKGGLRSERYDWLFGVPTLEDIAHLLYRWKKSAELELKDGTQHLRGGMWVELKKPEWIKLQTGMRMEDLFLEELQRLPVHLRDMFFPPSSCSMDMDQSLVMPPPLAVHCFESKSLKYLHSKFQSLKKKGLLGSHNNSVIPPTVLLLGQKKCHTFNEWSSMANYVDAINLDKACLWNNRTSLDGAFTGEEGANFVTEAHKNDLALFAWTERAEKEFLLEPFSDAESEMLALMCSVGIDGMFAENVDIAVRAASLGCSTPLAVLQHRQEESQVDVSFGWKIPLLLPGIAIAALLLVVAAVIQGVSTFRKATKCPQKIRLH